MPQTTAAPPRSLFRRLSLRRIVTSNRFIPQVDGFRFLAIGIVLLAHILSRCPTPASMGIFGRLFYRAFTDGKHGVYLFFSISGFILALPFARHHLLGSKPVALGSYFKRRITRLEPPYILAMVLRAPALLFLKQAAAGAVGLHLLASLLYVHNVVFVQGSIINPPAWSLEIEIQFYILAPLLSSVFLIRSRSVRRIFILAVTLISGLAATLFIPADGRASLTLLNYFQYFAAGFLLCDLYVANESFSLPSWAWDVIGACSLIWILFSANHWYPVLLPVVTLCLYMAGFFGNLVRRIFSITFITIIGGMCYSLYLTHPVVLTMVHGLLARVSIASWPVAAQTAAIYGMSLAGMLAIGTVYFIFIERPCMDPKWPQQLANRFSAKSKRSA